MIELITEGDAQNTLRQWMPDWRNKYEYPDLKNTLPRYWAWEFLRRNSKYFALWKNLTEQVKSKQITYLEFSDIFTKQFAIIDGFPPHPANPRPDSLKFITEIVHDITHSNNEKISITLNGPFRQNDAIAHLKYAEYKLGMYIKYYEIIDTIKINKRWCSRQKTELYQNYLRILDAKMFDNTSDSEIAKHIYPQNENADLIHKVRDAYKAAKRLRDKQFMLIPMGGEIKFIEIPLQNTVPAMHS